MKTNREWHLENRMPKNPTFEQRVKWHLEHQKNCQCRPIPEKLLEEMTNSNTTLMHFLEAQNKMYLTAFSEIEKGKKETHWMWFIFPQIKGLGHSDTANYYAIANLKEAEEFLQHPILGKHLIEITTLLLHLKQKSVETIFGDLDALKLRSSMTLFALLKNTNPVFQEVLDTYFSGLSDPLTLSIINSQIMRASHS